MEMAKDPEKQSEYEDQDEPVAEAEVEEAVDPERPRCPRCGWHNTRLSHTKSLLDPLLRPFSFRAFRCRSCGNRFRAIHRVPKA
jgi:uncharacterized protein with PIN domain